MQSQTARGIHVSSGGDRFGEPRKIWGLIPLTVLVSSKDTGGAFFSMQHTDMPKGGPPRHVHQAQDEWFYVTDGEYVFEIGEEKFRLKAGDSLLAPRKIAHAWACVSEKGTILTTLAPAGSFETFILDTAKYATLPSPEEIAKAFAAHEMTVVGPPLKVD